MRTQDPRHHLFDTLLVAVGTLQCFMVECNSPCSSRISCFAEVGGVYEIDISLRNVSNVSRRIRLLPPSSQYFFASQLRYPSNHGTVAPGMQCQVTLRFCPDSLADYRDTFGVESESGRQEIQISASRPYPSLTLLPIVFVGPVALGN